MFSYVKSIFGYFMPNNSSDDEDHEKDKFLSSQIMEILKNEENDEEENIEHQLERSHCKDAACYKRTGVITLIEDGYVLIDGMIYFDTSACNIHLNINDKVEYLCYKGENDSIVVVRILDNHGIFWGEDDEEAVYETSYEVVEHVFVGQVDYREDRTVFIKDTTLKFNLDTVTATFVPVEGDWIELLCKVQCDDEKPMDISYDMVVEVLSFKAVRSKVKDAIVTEWTGETGVCDQQIFFDKDCIVDGGQPTLHSKVIIEAIESNQGRCSWRVLKMVVTEISSEENGTIVNSKEEASLQVEKQHNIHVTFPLKFEQVYFHNNPCITLNITNNNDWDIILHKWMILCKKKDSQVYIDPFLRESKTIPPKSTFSLTITCQPKFYGRTKEHLIIKFKGFQVDRFIEVNVLANNMPVTNTINSSERTNNRNIDYINKMKNMRKTEDTRSIMFGERPKRPPHFIAVKIGMYNIPNKVWNAVLGDSNETVYSLDYGNIISRIETGLPCLLRSLNINNYTDRWHTLVYMEEIQNTLSMRCYDIAKGFLDRHGEYLGIKIRGLAEKRPSLIIGDKVVVKDIYDKIEPAYEGYIHAIKGEEVLVKFNAHFHQTYTGSDVSIEFHMSRSVYRKAHHAINLAISNLGVGVLFPNRVKAQSPQILPEKLESIQWFNKSLNDGQKAAVKNILLGECRPMPYCIYGPPGTGKTITVIETILQILAQFPDSRILVAAPSNSAANLVAERLLDYKNLSSVSMVRIVANHLVESENVPEIIKPYCATIDIAREGSGRSLHEVKDGMNLNVPASYIARYRVSIGTCYCLGTMMYLGLPKGHYTHVIVDEAGQALEPEIMVPLTLIDKDHGQIILSGDPKQLGPVVMSIYCKEFGYDESYFSRVLDLFPYHKDFHAYAKGFNEKLVTRLIENYRSLQAVIKLPSEMFYDGTLVANLQSDVPWVGRLLDVLSEIYESENNRSGGIFVHGIRGCNDRALDSPSWYNPQEASMVAMTIAKLYKKHVSPDDIGIITPYIAQIKHIRMLFDAMGLEKPKIGTVEEFQGQERPIIIISMVRTSENQIHDDKRFALGFIKSPKRLNVALTRAQVAVLMFCDPHLLCRDPLWQRVIKHAVSMDMYAGCDLPPELVTKQ